MRSPQRSALLVAVIVFLQTFGENLWKRFVPKLLETFGAPVAAIGAYGSLHDLLDGAYQYPGGWLSDRLGHRRALFLFIGVAIAGYVAFAAAWHWMFVMAALPLVMAWQSMASPTLFAVIGAALPRERRAMGFTVQSILRRVPLAVSPIVGGIVLERLGTVRGMRVNLMFGVAAAAAALLVVAAIAPAAASRDALRLRGVWRTFPRSLRALLVSDIFIRLCEGLVDVFLVVYATTIAGVSMPQFGLLIAVQMGTSMLSYAPAAALADRFGRKPFVVATYVAFAAFPAAVVRAETFDGLLLAYVVGGLRELGEPARKALIVDLVQPGLRGRSVGLYYLVRSVAVAPAAILGAGLWSIAPELPFHAATAIGLVGAAVFTVTVQEEDVWS